MPRIQSLRIVCSRCPAPATLVVCSMDGVVRERVCPQCLRDAYAAEVAHEQDAMRYNWYCVEYPPLEES